MRGRALGAELQTRRGTKEQIPLSIDITGVLIGLVCGFSGTIHIISDSVHVTLNLTSKKFEILSAYLVIIMRNRPTGSVSSPIV